MSLGLGQIPLFQSLPPEEIRHLENALPSMDFPPGKVLVHEGKSDEKFFILLDGKVEVIKALGLPEERLVDTCEAGSLLGEMSLFSGHNQHTASVRSITPLRLLQVTRSDLTNLIQRQPQLAYGIVKMLSKRLEESENSTIKDLREKNQRLQEAYDELKTAQDQLIEKEKLEKEVQIAKQIQQSILPESMPEISGYDFGALMIPARAVGGDFYTFIKLPKDRLGIVVGDVSDKGIPAALYMALCYSLIRAEAIRTNSPVDALKYMNEQLVQMNSSNMFVTLVYGILEPVTGKFHYARCAHPTPFLVDAQGMLAPVAMSSAPPLGLFEDSPIDEETLILPPGGTLLVYSDGISETANLKGEDFGPDKLLNAITSHSLKPAQALCVSLWEAVQAHGKGLPQQDDFTVVTVKRSLTD